MEEIKVNDVQVKTVNIAIQVIKINNNRMTLAVFEQIEKEHLIDPTTMGLRGIPLGRVNYHTKKCPKAAQHLHILWQKNNELRHAIVFDKPHEKIIQRCSPTTHKYFYTTVFLNLPEKANLEWKTQYEKLSSLPQLFIAV